MRPTKENTKDNEELVTCSSCGSRIHMCAIYQHMRCPVCGVRQYRISKDELTSKSPKEYDKADMFR